MSLKNRVVYPESNFYLLYFVKPNPFALQCFYDRFPYLAGEWPDLSELTLDDFIEIEASMNALHLHPDLDVRPKSEPDTAA